MTVVCDMKPSLYLRGGKICTCGLLISSKMASAA